MSIVLISYDIKSLRYHRHFTVFGYSKYLIAPHGTLQQHMIQALGLSHAWTKLTWYAAKVHQKGMTRHKQYAWVWYFFTIQNAALIWLNTSSSTALGITIIILVLFNLDWVSWMFMSARPTKTQVHLFTNENNQSSSIDLFVVCIHVLSANNHWKSKKLTPLLLVCIQQKSSKMVHYQRCFLRANIIPFFSQYKINLVQSDANIRQSLREETLQTVFLNSISFGFPSDYANKLSISNMYANYAFKCLPIDV